MSERVRFGISMGALAVSLALVVGCSSAKRATAASSPSTSPVVGTALSDRSFSPDDLDATLDGLAQVDVYPAVDHNTESLAVPASCAQDASALENFGNMDWVEHEGTDASGRDVVVEVEVGQLASPSMLAKLFTQMSGIETSCHIDALTGHKAEPATITPLAIPRPAGTSQFSANEFASADGNVYEQVLLGSGRVAYEVWIRVSDNADNKEVPADPTFTGAVVSELFANYVQAHSTAPLQP